MSKIKDLKHLGENDLFPDELIERYDSDYELVKEELRSEADELKQSNIALLKDYIKSGFDEEVITNVVCTIVNRNGILPEL